MRKIPMCILLMILMFGCDNKLPEPEPEPSLPGLGVSDPLVFEGGTNARLRFEITAFGEFTNEITINYQAEGKTAEPGKDFVEGGGTVSIAPGSSSVIVEVAVMDDAIKEVEEKVYLRLLTATNAEVKDSVGEGTIQDDDVVNYDAEGYETAEVLYGYDLVWGEEFDEAEVDTTAFNYDIGNGCPNLCGWGNRELQYYTQEKENVFIEDGKLVIRAVKLQPTGFESAKLHTKGKKEFQYGRIDVRARLPFGQGIWPAIWMLGSNIDDVSWPACGEIDIMEMVGHTPKITHGTAHWGAQGAGSSTFKTSSFILEENFSEKFHVFSLIWEENELVWYVDETKFQTITPNDMQGEQYRFNAPFYLILNLAVGGNWPGEPDETTVFPQQMEIDYVRVFQ